jgi:hypothetical protein
MLKSKDKKLTRDEVRKMIRKEVMRVVVQVIDETNAKMAEKLEPVVGFKYIESTYVEGYQNDNN